MKISFILFSIKTGGGTRVIFELANVLSKEHEVHIRYLRTGESNSFEVEDKVSVNSLTSKNGVVGIGFGLLQLIRMLRKKDAIWISSGSTILPFLFSSKGVYHFIQGNDYNLFDDRYLIRSKLMLRIYKAVTRAAYRYNNVIFLFNSNYSYQKYVEVSGRNVGFRLIHPAVDHRFFFSCVDRVPNASYERLRIGVVARKHPSKGFQTFLDSFRLLRNKNNIDVVIITHDDLSHFDMPLDWKVVKPVNDNQLAQYYRDCNIFVSVSWEEGFGLPALEAMACGCAVITSDSKGCREYAYHMENALIFPAQDVEQLRTCVDRLIEDSQLRYNLVRNGLETAKNFTWENSKRQLLQVLGND